MPRPLHQPRMTGRFVALLLVSAFAVFTPLHARLSALASPPEWRKLEAWQQTITRPEFLRLINTYYSPNGEFWKYTDLGEDRVTLFDDKEQTIPLFTLYFTPADEENRSLPRSYFSPGLKNPEHPLAGKRICLDPGHIGGEFAKIEERSFHVGTTAPVEEAALNLAVCKRLERLLQAAGATVVWTKQDLKPVTPLRTDDLIDEAFRTMSGSSTIKTQAAPLASTLARLRARAEMLFYRTAEIRARAEVVSRLDPDLTLCVHYNAAPWGNPANPTLVDINRLVVFVNGVYLESELAYEDQKFELMQRVLDQTAEGELTAAGDIAEAVADRMKLPPEKYEKWPSVVRVGPNPYVYARNLIANRIFRGPVVFAEGPYMNSKETYERLVAGDYEGTRVIGGKRLPSIHQEFAEALASGLIRFYQHPAKEAVKEEPPVPESKPALKPKTYPLQQKGGK